jgi:hypothetical protein
MQMRNPVAALIQGIDDVTGTERYSDRSRVIELVERPRRRIEAKSVNDADGVGVGLRRPVAVKVRQDMKISGKRRTLRCQRGLDACGHDGVAIGTRDCGLRCASRGYGRAGRRLPIARLR